MRRIWAVARNTVSQALSMRVFYAVFFLLIVVVPLLGVLVTGDGTLKGKLQTFTSYSVGLTGLVLSLLSIVLSIFTLSNDIKRRNLFLVLSKPVRRFELLLGKLIGVMLVNLFMLALFGGIIYGVTLLMPKFAEAPPSERISAEKEFFTARVSYKDSLDIQAARTAAAERYNELKDQNRLPDGMTPNQVMTTLIGEEIGKQKSVPVGGRRVWEFENMPPGEPNEYLFIKYRYVVASPTPDGKVYGTWLVGDLRQEKLGPNQWDSPILRLDRADAVNSTQQVAVPSEVVTPDGYLGVAFINVPLNRTTVIPDDMELLFKGGTFTGNFLRIMLMVYSQLTFLAMLGVSAATFLSFPSAIFVSIVLYFIGTINLFIVDSLKYFGEGVFFFIFNKVVSALIWLLPQFDGDRDPTRFLVNSELITWSFLGRVFLTIVFVKGLLLMIMGIIIFRKREIAKVSV